MATSIDRPIDRHRGEHDHHGEHNHGQCISTALRTASQVCSERGLKLTPIRRRVLELVWQQHEPVGAYDLMAGFSRDGRRAAPPTIYRALDFLREAGLVHRIDSLNAFIGCDAANTPHTEQFLVCRACHHVTELHDPALSRLLARKAGEAGFVADAQSIEIKGLCRYCVGRTDVAGAARG